MADRADMKGDETPATRPVYRLGGQGRRAAEDERLDLLERLFDPASCRSGRPACRLARSGVARDA